MPKYDAYGHSLYEDPYPTYAELRGRCPVYRDEQKDFWALFRFADVKSTSRDWQRFTSTSGSFLEEELEAMLEFMPPEGKFGAWPADDVLSLRDRSLIVVAALIAQGGSRAGSGRTCAGRSSTARPARSWTRS